MVGLHLFSYSASLSMSSGNEIPLSTISCLIPKNFLHRSVKEGNVFGLTCDEYVSSTLQPTTETSPTSIISGKNPFGFFRCWGIVNSKSKNKNRCSSIRSLPYHLCHSFLFDTPTRTSSNANSILNIQIGCILYICQMPTNIFKNEKK
ncbi:hypothetical protein MC28_4179 [Bacillus thuringiensis MC28]|nr:hypothetical protein MC28_4179 [Bacillus thuringiensis MC28]